ncbi:MAG: rRNA maturation RNase YbeY [Proteobacteria bacterium]|nr:rRNA maturation RNase YbeY [Pseudomonadota bacterium]
MTCPRWNELDFDADATARKMIPAAIASAKIPAAALRAGALEVSVVLADDNTVRNLNRAYRNKDKPTNVLSFAALESASPGPAEIVLPLGDIVFGYETIERESNKTRKRFADHFSHLLVHGTLHLLGYDHESDMDADIMESLEIQVLSRYGIDNPYAQGNNDA